MSVINQMLLDLERRRASGEECDRIPDHVRALPGSSSAPRDYALQLIVVAVLVVLAVAGGAYWWWQYGIPGLAKPPLIAPVSEHENAERIARRMSLDLAKTPPLADAPPVTDAAAPTGIPTQSVIVSEPPAWATSRVEQPPVVARSEPAAEPAQPANEPERRAVPKPAAKPAAAVEAPVVAKTTAVSPVPAGIDKRMRDQTPRQRAEVEYTRGASALQQGRLAEARSGFEAALQTDPAYHAARQALAGVLLDAGQPAEAMLILQEGLQLAPTQFGFAMMVARLHVDRGEIDAAVQTLARSADYAGNSADYAGFYAGLLQRQKKHAEAVGMFDRALRLRPNSGVWLLGMGISLEALGRGAEAQESFRRARATGNLTPELQTFADQRLR
jgi:MSHA biogenesis protein MshN